MYAIIGLVAYILVGSLAVTIYAVLDVKAKERKRQTRLYYAQHIAPHRKRR